jgi:hypothetical protein
MSSKMHSTIRPSVWKALTSKRASGADLERNHDVTVFEEAEAAVCAVGESAWAEKQTVPALPSNRTSRALLPLLGAWAKIATRRAAARLHADVPIR